MVARTINKGKQVSKAVAQKKMTEKAFRAEKAAKIWNAHPLFEGKFDNLDESTRQKSAIQLTNQARYMKQLTEAETSAEFQRMAPANVMRLVQLTMTNLNRGNVFNEFAMETARDVIYYIKPYLGKPHAGNFMFANRSDIYDGSEGQDPYGFVKGTINSSNNVTEINSRRTAYETTEDRFAQQLQNGIVDGLKISFNTEAFKSGVKEGGAGYVPGYAVIYRGTNPNDVIAFQDSTTYEFYMATELEGKVTVKADDAAGTVELVAVEGAEGAEEALAELTNVGINGFARFEAESDYEGETLGDVTLLMSEYSLRPHRTSIGVSWTKLAEITLGASFNTQLDDVLLGTASDVIHAQMDYGAFKEAYRLARTNPRNYTVRFNAAYTGTEQVENTKGETVTTFAKDGYVDNAQTFSSALEIASAAVYEDRKRGAINKIVVGGSLAAYLKLNAGFSPKGAQEPVGVYKIGELDGIEIFRAPIEVIPTNEALCVYKNNKVENDVAITYGTLVPFVSARMDYPTFYSRAGLATYGDRAILNKNYLARVIVDGLKDSYGAITVGA